MQGREARLEHRRRESIEMIQGSIRGHDARANLFTHTYATYVARAEDETLSDRGRTCARAGPRASC